LAQPEAQLEMFTDLIWKLYVASAIVEYTAVQFLESHSNRGNRINLEPLNVEE